MASSLGDMIFRLGLNIDGFDKNAGTIAQRLKAIDRDVAKTFGGFEKIGDKLQTMGVALSSGITLPLAGVGVAATKMAADFDLGLRKVGSLVGGFTDKEMKALTDQTLAVSRALGIDAVKATDALYEAISAGVPKENAVDFLAVASKAAIAGVTDTKVAVDGLTSIINSYGLKTSDAKEISDAMFQSVNIGKFQFNELASAISIATPLASSLGIGFKEVLAAGATLTSQGFSISEALTSVRSAMTAIISPNKAMQAVLESTGYATGEALLKAKGFQGALETLREATGGSVSTLTDAYGRVEALGAGLKLTGEFAAKAHADIDSVRRSSEGAGAATAAYNEINKSSTRQFEMAVTQIKATAIELGVALLPAVNNLLRASQPLITMLTDAVKWFTSLDQSTQTVILGFTGAVAVIGPLALGFGGLISTAAQVGAAFMSLAGISGLGAVMPVLQQLPGMASNVAFAVTNNLTSALTGGELMLLRFGQAALVAAAAFVGWQLGSWAYEQIPGVKALGDSVADLILKIPGVESVVLKLTGASGKLEEAQKSAAFTTQKLEDALKRKGITVEKAGLSTEEYAKKLLDASKQAGLMGNAHQTARAKVEEAKKQIQQTQAQTKAYQQAMKELGGEVQSTASHHRHAKDLVKEFGDGIPKAILEEYERRLKAAKRAVAESTVEHTLAVLAGKDWNAQLDKNITAAQALNDALVTLQSDGLAKHIAKVNETDLAHAELAEHMKDMARIGAEQFGKLETASTKSAEKQKSTWEGFGKDVSTVFTNFAQDIAKDIFDGDLSFGEKAKKMLASLGTAVTAKFIEPATKALGDFVSGVLGDLLGGKGLGGVLSRLQDIGDGIGKIFGVGSSAASTVAGAATNAGGAAAPAAGSASSAAASSGLAGIVGAVGSVVSAVSGIISNFQLAKQETTLNAIETSTRYLKIWTGEQNQNMLWCLQTMTARSQYMVTALDSIGQYASEQLGWLERIGAVLESPVPVMPAAATAGGSGSSFTLILNEPRFQGRDDIDYLMEEVERRMGRVGQGF